LKTFLTQFRSALPLTSDPPVICFWKWIGWKDYKVPKKVQFRERFCQKTEKNSPRPFLPALVYLLSPRFPVLRHTNYYPPSAVAERGPCGPRHPPLPPSPLSPHRLPDLPPVPSPPVEVAAAAFVVTELLYSAALPLPAHRHTRPLADA
jgi:hypothetical protein